MMSSRGVAPRSLTIAALALAAASCTHESRGAAELSSDPVAVARAQLTELAAAPVVRRVRVHRNNAIDPWGSRPSPDGRFLLATQWSTGDLVALDFVADTMHSLTGKKSWADGDGFAYGAAYSPDGRTVLYAWFSAADALELRAMAMAGPDSGKSRKVFSDDDVTFFQPSVTPDNRTVIGMVQRRDRTNQIASVPLVGGDLRVLKSFDWRYPQNLAISPDGRWLAYDFPPDAQNPARDVYLITLDGSREVTLVRGPLNEIVVGWTPDGRYLMYAAESGGAPASVHAVPVSDGKAAGSPVLVRSDLWRMLPLGTSANGRFVYAVETGRRDVFTAALDPSDGTLLSEPVSASASAPDALPWAIAFSPDGQYVAYLAARGPVLGSGPSDIVIRGLESSEVRRVSPRLTQIGGMRWIPGHRILVITALDENRKHVVARLDLDTGTMTTMDQPPDGARFIALTPDGSRMYYAANEGRTLHVQSFELASREKKLLHTIEDQSWPAGITLSPEGRELAVVTRPRSGPNSIVLVPTSGGNARTLYTLPAGLTSHPVARADWSPDGRFIYFSVFKEEPALEIWRVDVRDGSVKPTGLAGDAITRVQISPDGRRIGFGLSNFASEIWVMELPQLPATAQRVGAVRR